MAASCCCCHLVLLFGVCFEAAQQWEKKHIIIEEIVKIEEEGNLGKITVGLNESQTRIAK